MAGQKYGEIEYSVGFSIDNQSLQTLKKSLQEISAMTTEQYQKATFDTSKNKSLAQSRKELIEIQKEAALVQTALEKAFNANLGTTNITKFSQSLKGVDLTKLYKDLTSLGPAGTTAFRSLATGLTTMNIQMKESHKLLDKMATSLKNTVQWGISSSVYNTLAGSLQKAWGYAKNLDSALNDIRIVSGQSAQEMEKFAIQANRAAQSLGASTLDFAKASLIYFQQGLGTEEASARAEVTVKMANVLGASAQEVSDYMTAIWNNFDTGSKSLEYFADVITALGASTAASSEEIATGLEKFASVAKTVGLSYEYATAALATVVAQTRQSADTVGTAFKTIFARIQDLELGKTLEDGTTLGNYAEQLQKVGINIKDQYGELKKMDTILNEIGAKWQTLSQAQKVALAENVAGTRQYTQLVALFDNWDKVQTNISTASGSLGTLQKQQDIYLESTEAHLTQLSTATERLMSSFIDNKGINSLIDSLTNIVKLVSNFVEGIGGGGNALLMLGSIGTQVFSNQIATGLTTTIRNLQKTKQAAMDAETAINNLKLLNENKEIQNDPVWKELKDVIAEFQSVMTKMDQDSINQITQWITQLEELLNQRVQQEEKLNIAIDYIKSVQNIDKETDLDENAAIEAAANAQKKLTENIKGSVDEQNKLIGGYEQYLALVEKAQRRMERDYKTKKEDWGSKKWQQDETGKAKNKGDVMKDDAENIKKNMLAAAEQAEIFSNNLSGALTKEEKDNIVNKVKALREQLSNEANYIYTVKSSSNQRPRTSFNKNITTGFYDPLVKDLKDAASKAQQHINTATQKISESASKEYEKATKKLNNDIDNTSQKIKGAVDVAKQTINTEQWVKLASAVGQASTALNSFVNIWNIFKNDSLSAGEKIIQIISALATSIAMFGNSMKLIKENIGVIADTAKKIAVNYYIEEAAAKKVAKTKTQETAAVALNNKVKQKGIVANTQYAASQGKLTTANISTAATFKGLTHAIGQTLLALAPYVAIAAAIGVAAYAIYQSVTKNEREYKTLQQAQENLTKSADELATSLNDLKQSWDSFKDAKNTLDGCITYSSEWNEQLKKVNEEVQSILDKYPDLLNIEGIIKSSGNYLSFDEEKLNEYIEKKEAALDNTKYAKYINQLTLYGKDRERALETVRISVAERSQNTGYDSRNSNTKIWSTYLTEEEQRKLGQTGLSKKDYEALVSQIAEKYANENGGSNKNYYTSTIERTLKDQQGTFQNIAQTLKSIDTNVNNINKIIVPDKVKEQGGRYGSVLWQGEQAGKLPDIQETVREAERSGVDRVSEEFDVDAITFMKMFLESRGEEFSQAKFTNVDYGDEERQYEYNGQRYTADEMAASIAAYRQQGGQFDLYQSDHIERWQKALEEMDKQIVSQEEIITRANEERGKVSQKYNINSDLADKILSRDVDSLTPEDINKIKEIIDADQNLEQSLKDLGIKIDETDGVPSMKEFLNAIKGSKTSTAGELKDLQNQSFRTQSNAKAKEIEADANGFYKYTQELIKNSKALKENDSFAITAAEHHYKLSKKLDTLNTALKDGEDSLKKWQKRQNLTPDEMEHVGKAITAVKDILGKDISEDFVRDHLKEIQKLASGDIKVLDDLQKAATKDFIVNLKTDWKDKLPNEVNDLVKYIQGLDLEKIQIGTEIDPQLVEKLNILLRNFDITKEQANEILAGIGYNPTIDTVPATLVDSNSETATYQYTDPTTGETKTFTNKATTDVQGQINIPVINAGNTKFKGANVGNFKYKPPSNSGKGKSGGGSKSKPKKEKHIDDEVDRYHKINTQITKIDNSLKKLQSQQNKLVGGNLLRNLNQQWSLLNTQVNNYNTKLKIAEGEQDELAKKLAAQGVVFNSDKTVSNYKEALDAAEAEYNALVDKYNGLTKAQQEKWDNDEILSKAKEKYEKFKSDIDRYDEVTVSLIPELEQSKLDALEQQIEIQIQKFNLKLEITLDMNQATRDWNAWKKKNIQGIRESDILGNAKARKADLQTYYAANGRGDIQAQTSQVQSILRELKIMDEGGLSSTYSAKAADGTTVNDRAKALDELKDKYTALMQSIEDAEQVERDLHQAVLDQIAASQEAFDKQIDNYNLLNDLIEHDKKIIQLVYGEDSYEELDQFYTRQQENYNDTLDFQRQEKQFWAEQMSAEQTRVDNLQKELSTLEENSAEWKEVQDEYLDAEERLEAVTENWKTVTEELDATLEKGLQGAVDRFQNAINGIFKALNNEVTGGKGLDFVNEQWELINKNADRYLDTINATYGIRELEKKYTDAINKSDNTKAQQKLKKIMDEQLATLEEKDRLTQYDLDRANKLYELEVARLALEDARQNKSQMRLRRDSQGNYTYQYTANQDEIQKAQDQVDQLTNSLYNFDKERYNQILNDAYSIYSEYQQKMAEAAMITDPEKRAEKEKLIQEQYNELMVQIEQDYLDSKYNLQESAFEDWKNLNDLSEEAFANLTNTEKDLILREMVPTWKTGVSDMLDYFLTGEDGEGGIAAIDLAFTKTSNSVKSKTNEMSQSFQEAAQNIVDNTNNMNDTFNGESGFATVTKKSWQKITKAQKTYSSDIAALEESSGKTFEEIKSGLDEDITKTETLVKDNKDLINCYKKELKYVKKVYDEVVKLTKQYKDAEEAAKNAATAAYEYEHKEKNKQIDEIEDEEKNGQQGNQGNNNENNNETPEEKQEPTKVEPQGNGQVDVGDKVTINSSYATSVGSGYIKNPYYKKGSKLYIQNTNYKSKGWVHVGTSPDFSKSSSWVGWIKIKDISGYDTGGYTGNWSGQGRLATLHQKELVLNQSDTKNMLNAISVMRGLTYSLGSTVLSKLANASASGYTNVSGGNGLLEQDVHIDASFPNVRNAREIEEALNNLVNVAAQRVMENR